MAANAHGDEAAERSRSSSFRRCSSAFSARLLAGWPAFVLSNSCPAPPPPPAAVAAVPAIPTSGGGGGGGGSRCEEWRRRRRGWSPPHEEWRRWRWRWRRQAPRGCRGQRWKMRRGEGGGGVGCWGGGGVLWRWGGPEGVIWRYRNEALVRRHLRPTTSDQVLVRRHSNSHSLIRPLPAASLTRSLSQGPCPPSFSPHKAS